MITENDNVTGNAASGNPGNKELAEGIHVEIRGNQYE
jgi:hypothetical protein